MQMKFDRKKLSNKILLNLYNEIIKPRIIEEKMINLIRQGKISKWFSGIGQEAISVGSASAIEYDEYILTMHRNLGVFTYRNLPLNKLFSQFEGKFNGYTKGRDRSFHFGTKDFKIVGMISHLAAQLGVADGIALGHLLNKEKKVVLVFTGEGGTSEGDFHEAVNIASVWNLPVIFLIENNGYGLSTPINDQFKCEKLSDKGIGYGIESKTIDGNNILEVYSTLKDYAESIRNKPRPVLIEAISFRMHGHEEASGTKYIPKSIVVGWSKRDPIKNYEEYLIKEKILDENKIQKIKNDFKKKVDAEWNKALNESELDVNLKKEIDDVYSPFEQKIILPNSNKLSNKRFIDAISDALKQSLNRFPELIIMGQDIAEYGGVFKVTKGFVEEFGKDRIRNTPLCESSIIGAGLGYSIYGGKSVIEMQFADFVADGFNQIVNNLAKIHYRWGQNADVVIRMPTGAGVNAGPFHSQSNESWFFHTPGLKIVYPSNPYDAKGLLNSSIEDPNPVLFFEHKALYRSMYEEIPDDYYTTEIGKANIIQEGKDITIITYGMGVRWAKKVLKEFTNISIEIIDLKTLLPWDKNCIKNSTIKTGKVLILHEDCITGGIGAEISAWITENCFEYLDGPIVRVGGLDSPVPFNSHLEKKFLPESRLKIKIQYLINY